MKRLYVVEDASMFFVVAEDEEDACRILDRHVPDGEYTLSEVEAITSEDFDLVPIDAMRTVKQILDEGNLELTVEEDEEGDHD